jgi:hypothetical protein
MIKVLLPASDIPLGSTVTKKNGEKVYILRDSIKIFSTNKDVTIPAEDGSRFLIASGDPTGYFDVGNACVVSNTTILCWHAEIEVLIDYLHGIVDGPHQ